MKSTDLRIGNFILDSIFPERQCRVGRLCIPYSEYPITYFYEKAHEHTPREGVGLVGIPLTKEWLMKFGAKNMIDVYWISLYNLKAELHFEVYEKEIVTTIKSDFSNLILDQIKCVHELQNIYYQLTKEELVLAVTPINTSANGA